MEYSNNLFSDVGHIRSKVHFKNLLKKYVQLMTLDFLSDSGFFEDHIFYGGTCLSLFYGDPRLSEDLDFQSCGENKSVDIDHLGKEMEKHFRRLGYESPYFSFRLNEKSNVISTNISLNAKEIFKILKMKNAFVNSFNPDETVRVAIDLNQEQIQGYNTTIANFYESKKILLMDEQSILACKIAAILERDKVRKHIKGRDFFDYLFLLRSKVKVNTGYLFNQLNRKRKLYSSKNDILNELTEVFKNIDEQAIKTDLTSFVLDLNILESITKKDLLKTITQLGFENENEKKDTSLDMEM